MIRQIDNFSPGAVPRGGVVPSSHKRLELLHAIIRQFSGGNQGTREDIPAPGGLREETTFICFYTSRGYLKCHEMLISATPSLGDKVTCRYSGFTFQTFV